MDMAILLHDGLCWTTRLAICHVRFYDTSPTRAKYAGAVMVGVGAFSGIFLASSWFRQSGIVFSLPPAGTD